MTASTRPTLKDIARLANCSTAVVSTVINNARGNTTVSEQMRERVQRVARELGYQPNFASQSLVRQSTQTLGIYIPPQPWAGPGYNYDNEVIRGIEIACRARSYDLLIINFSGSEGPEACIEKFAQRRIEGLVLVHAEFDSPWIDRVAKASRNVVAVDFPEARPNLDVVMFNNARVGELAVAHLVDLGHTRIGFLGSCREPRSVDGGARERAYLKAMNDRGLAVDPRWIFNAGTAGRSLKPEDAVCQIEGKLGGDYFANLGESRPTAVISYGDLPAMHAMIQLQARGLKVPDDISLVGVDNSEWARVVEPYLTSVGKPLEAMGHRAAELAIERARSSSGRRQSICEVFEPTLAVRGSAAAPAL